MARIHKAVLSRDRLQQRDEGSPSPSDGSGLRMAEALGRLAAAGGPDIEDPAAWERRMREDRSLPGRDD